jgi:hypothetical protein
MEFWAPSEDVIEPAAIARYACGLKVPRQDVEMPVERIVQGAAAKTAVSGDALAHPAALDWFVEFASARAASGSHRMRAVERPASGDLSSSNTNVAGAGGIPRPSA